MTPQTSTDINYTRGNHAHLDTQVLFVRAFHVSHYKLPPMLSTNPMSHNHIHSKNSDFPFYANIPGAEHPPQPHSLPRK